jgi:hypothetical protein
MPPDQHTSTADRLDTAIHAAANAPSTPSIVKNWLLALLAGDAADVRHYTDGDALRVAATASTATTT